mgnify:CR=1 FL=1
MSDKRVDYITWDEYFMGVAALSGRRSKDPSTQVGACIVSRITRSFLWAITVSQKAVQMMNFHGARNMNWMTRTMQNISTLP